MIQSLYIVFQITTQGPRYFTSLAHVLDLTMRIMVIIFLLPVDDELSTLHIGCGSIAVLCSWTTLIQYLKVVPFLGTYIIVVQTIFWTLMKVCVESSI